MTDSKTDEQILEEEKNRKGSGSSLVENRFYAPLTNDANIPPFDIEYVPHRSQGLQSASDMWIDKGRLFAGVPKEKLDLLNIKKQMRE